MLAMLLVPPVRPRPRMQRRPGMSRVASDEIKVVITPLHKIIHLGNASLAFPTLLRTDSQAAYAK